MFLISVRQRCTCDICLVGTPIPSLSAPFPTPSPVSPSLYLLSPFSGVRGTTPEKILKFHMLVHAFLLILEPNLSTKCY